GIANLHVATASTGDLSEEYFLPVILQDDVHDTLSFPGLNTRLLVHFAMRIDHLYALDEIGGQVAGSHRDVAPEENLAVYSDFKHLLPVGDYPAVARDAHARQPFQYLLQQRVFPEFIGGEIVLDGVATNFNRPDPGYEDLLDEDPFGPQHHGHQNHFGRRRRCLVITVRKLVADHAECYPKLLPYHTGETVPAVFAGDGRHRVQDGRQAHRDAWQWCSRRINDHASHVPPLILRVGEERHENGEPRKQDSMCATARQFSR